MFLQKKKKIYYMKPAPLKNQTLLVKPVNVIKKAKIFSAFFLGLLFSNQKIAAQYYFYDNNYYENPVLFEIGASVDAINCLTDLGGHRGIAQQFVKDLNMGNTQMAGGVYFEVLFKNAVALRIEGTIGQVKAYDSVLKNVKASTFGRYERNLSFRSNITELALIAEFHPLFIFGKYDENRVAPRCSPYVAAGVGYFSFNPQAKLSNNWVDLQPLSTEGEGFAEYPDRKPYSLHQVNIPLGVGVKYELSPALNLRTELMYRILFTDYLDDVSTSYIDPSLYYNYFGSTKLTHALLLNDRQYELAPTHITTPGDQRGNAHNNDAYFTLNLKLGLTLGRKKIQNNQSKIRCFVF